MKLDFIRSLFAVKLTKSIDEQTLIINLDISSINRNIKTNRSWGLRDAEIDWKNWNFVGSTSMWMVISRMELGIDCWPTKQLYLTK